MSSGSILTSSLPFLEPTAGSPAPAEPIRIERLYWSHYEEMRAFLMANTRSAEQVETLLQDLYLRLVAMDDPGVIRNPSAYLNRIARNLLVDRLRQDERRLRHEVPVGDEEPDLPESRPSVAEQVHYQQLLDAYGRALAELPEAVQQAVRLHHLEGFTYRDIARKLGKSTSWVEKAVVRALLHCRPRLDDLDY